MNDRIKDKIIEIEQMLGELEEIRINDFETYERDFRVRGLYERYFEKIIEAVTDIAFLIAHEMKLKVDSEKEIFDILEKNKFIDTDLAHNLKDARGMRNIVSHEYGKIDNFLVFTSVNEELFKDVERFLNKIREEIKDD
jgi:uncharacterized protein YutE (UPF0331/DUF86 family)